MSKAGSNINRTLYFYRGEGLEINSELIPAYHSIKVPSDLELTFETAKEDCYLLVLQGKPINEKVVQHGPFVMNSEEEIRTTYRDYQQTQFGGWPWPKHEFVHDRTKGRFALHANGTEELK